MTSLLLLLGVTACSNDFLDMPIDSMPSDGKITLRYTVPEMQGVLTRAVDESTIKTLTLLIFNSSGDLVQVEDALELPSTDVDASSGTVMLTVDENIRKDGGLKFVMLANAPDTYNKSWFITKKGQVRDNIFTAATTSDISTTISGTQYLPMSGQLTLSEVLGFNVMPLYRTSAKTTVSMAVKDASGNMNTETEDSKTYYRAGNALPFEAYGSAKESSLFAGADPTTYRLGNALTGNVKVKDKVENTDSFYSHSTRNKTEGKAFVIVKATFPGDNKDYFYRLDYQTRDGMLDIEPNHWYQFVVDQVIGKGFETPAEAARNPTPLDGGNLTWKIYDHSPKVMNMVTDGVNFLGVSHEVYHQGNLTGTNTATEYLYIHISNKDNKYPEGPASGITLSDDKNWIEVGSPVVVTDPLEIGAAISVENETSGILYKVPVTFKSTTEPGSQKGTITVRWQGLSREVPVIWNRAFDPSELISSVVMQVYAGYYTSEQTEWKQSDYFDAFLGNDEDAGSVWGIESASNNGFSRNDGFHFPLMYGEDAENPWTYKYTVTFKNQTDNDYDWKFEQPDSQSEEYVAAINEYLQIDVESDNDEGIVTTSRTDTYGPKITLTFDSKGAGWNYAIGQFIVMVAPKNTGEWTEIPLKVYHTGFFHKDDYTHAVSDSYDSSRGYTYYEVAEVAGQYWLDRNIGAHSAELYIERGTGAAQYGMTDGRGAYFYVAKQVDKTPDFYSGICPPGYQIPYSSDWDAVRRSASFFTTDMGNHNTAYFRSGARYEDGSAKPVYFSKSRYYDAANKVGDSLTGYYWSSTTATGFEKTEIGRWLRGFVIIGESNYHNNSRIDYSGDKSGYAMSLRAVRKHTESTDNNTIGFFVKGATHVYAYYENEGGRVALTAWPGTPIANYSSAEAGYMNFRYTGAATPETLKVIFNYKAQNGQVISISKDGDGSIARITSTISPLDLEGWVTRGDKAPNGSIAITSDLISETTTVVNTDTDKYYWTISHTDASKVYLTAAEVEPEEEPVNFPTNSKFWIHSNLSGSWESQVMTDNGSGIWKVTINTTQTGTCNFGIRRTEGSNDNDQKDWIYGKTSLINMGVPVRAIVQNGSNGSNWILTDGPGDYTFTFDQNNMTLTVTKERQTVTIMLENVADWADCKIRFGYDANSYHPDKYGEFMEQITYNGKKYFRMIVNKSDFTNLNDDDVDVQFSRQEITNGTWSSFGIQHNQISDYKNRNIFFYKNTVGNGNIQYDSTLTSIDSNNLSIGWSKVLAIRVAKNDIEFDPILKYCYAWTEEGGYTSEWFENWNKHNIQYVENGDYYVWKSKVNGTPNSLTGCILKNSSGDTNVKTKDIKDGNITSETASVANTYNANYCYTIKIPQECPIPNTYIYRVYWKKGIQENIDNKDYVMNQVHTLNSEGAFEQGWNPWIGEIDGWYFYEFKPSNDNFNFNLMLHGEEWKIQMTDGTSVTIKKSIFDSNRRAWIVLTGQGKNYTGTIKQSPYLAK